VAKPYPSDIYKAKRGKTKRNNITNPRGTYLAVLETYPEMVEVLRYTYCAFIRFSDDWANQNRHVWINHDADLVTFNRRIYGKVCFLGCLDRDDWSDLYDEMDEQECRTYIVKREWYEHMQKLLREHRIGITEKELEQTSRKAAASL